MAEDRLEANKLNIERNTPRKLTWGTAAPKSRTKLSHGDSFGDKVAVATQPRAAKVIPTPTGPG